MNSDQITHFKGITNAKLVMKHWLFNKDLANISIRWFSCANTAARKEHEAAIGLIGLTSMLAITSLLNARKWFS